MNISVEPDRSLVFTYGEIRNKCPDLYDTITEDMIEEPRADAPLYLTVREALYWKLVTLAE